MWGADAQFNMACEEVGELISALNKYRRGRITDEKEVITEIADVQIMAEQLAEFFGSAGVLREKERKLQRLALRLQGSRLAIDGIEVTISGEPLERCKLRATCKYCGEDDRCLAKAKDMLNGGVHSDISCSLFATCERLKDWDRKHQYSPITLNFTSLPTVT